MTQPFSAGSLISTVDDLADWNDALVSGKLISTESYEQMTSGFVLTDGELFPYGFGLGLAQLRGQAMIAHSGGIHGFSAYGLWYPQEKVYVAVLTNSNGYMPSPTTVGKTVAAIIIGDPYPERKATNLSDSQMSRFVGSYAGEDAPPVEISIVKGGLEMDFGGLATYTLNAESIDTFFIEDSLTYMDVEWADDAVAKLSMYFSEGEPPTILTPVSD
jgi:CubicO group peptidase (beta-lactamase class C family)